MVKDNIPPQLLNLENGIKALIQKGKLVRLLSFEYIKAYCERIRGIPILHRKHTHRIWIRNDVLFVFDEQ